MARDIPGEEAWIKYLWLTIYGAVLIWSGIDPKDLFTWFLEVLPALIGVVVLAITYRSFRLTPLVYVLILIHCIILMVGGHYTYAQVPLFEHLKSFLGTTRNDYDKLGHFAQGFVPAMIVREVVLRKHIIRGAAWQATFIVCFCLALSALYEMFEWLVAVASGASAEAFLGTQGYVWDTQSDMAMALVGAIAALLVLSRWHDRQLARIGQAAPKATIGSDRTDRTS
ncbi:MAG: DUF2238 domain-containing protein [Gammaproteobacteria bacterium]